MFTNEELGKGKAFFTFFEQISRIPHGSEHTEAIASYLVRFAEERGLEVYRDGANNVLIRKAGTEGYEDHPTVVLQGHTDMVLAKTPDCPLDLLTDGLELYRDGDFLRARGTTLGADDGIAVAYALAILDAHDVAHPPLEALFTSDEEIGLLGAAAFDVRQLRGTRLLNIDSDGEGVFTVGCAGGARCDLSLPVARTAAAGDAYQLRVSGLSGGHSGMEIIKNRANAIRLLCEVLQTVPSVRIAALTGGHADNAIPTEAEAVILATGDVPSAVRDAVARVGAPYRLTDPTLSITVEPVTVKTALSVEDSARVLAMTLDAPNGVVRMSPDIEGLVETSLNAGMASLDDGGYSLTFSVRSSVEEQKEALLHRLATVAASVGGTSAVRGGYPAWEYRAQSPLRETAMRTYERMYGRPARAYVIHAGLECGVFAGKIADFDAISFGPENYDLHTPDERLSIPSAVRVYDFILSLLAEL